jgi:protein-disulfide isomerase
MRQLPKNARTQRDHYSRDWRNKPNPRPVSQKETEDMKRFTRQQAQDRGVSPLPRSAQVPVGWPTRQPQDALDGRMKKSALPFALFVSLFAVGTTATLALSGALAATATVIPAEQQRSILKDPGAAVLGVGVANPGVTVVEYFDYNCPYCRKLAPSIHTLVNTDHNVAVVFKEWPIFGGISVYAARSALASQWQGKYLTAHDALIGAPRLSRSAEVDETLRKAGIDMGELKRTLAAHGAQIDAILARNDAEAHSLGMRGTPGILVGRDVSTDIGDLAALRTAVAEARRAP